ncbi:MoaD/ThiS family protein [Flavisolibacter nicotianae]|uniref:MoaD/ThiS family protein n=1 Tax=Flavisolibacter nicotianae TaxID=2364882 RepID=UPI000EB03D49|nr:MoaD/ThiS family protein [Flavisolibacter nicotianae]
MKEITVLSFGAVADILGQSNLKLSNLSSTDELMQQLEKEYPALKNIPYAIAVNKQLVTGSASLEHNAIVALLPPFSGG